MSRGYESMLYWKRKMKANLHIHSRYSDGSLWPSEIAERAQELSLSCIAVTDHDTLGGTAELAAHADWRGIRAVSGCEIRCGVRELGYKSELLAYFPSGSFSATADLLRGAVHSRETLLRSILASAADLFDVSDLSYEELFALKYGPRAGGLERASVSMNRADLFRYLRERGLLPSCMSYKEFRREYFKSGRLPAGHIPRPEAATVAAAVLGDGGFLVVPHIGHQFRNSAAEMKQRKADLRRLLSYFRRIGAGGIEEYYYRNGDGERINRIVRAEADRFGFFVTYGSDCHGPGSGRDTLGLFAGDFRGFPAARTRH